MKQTEHNPPNDKALYEDYNAIPHMLTTTCDRKEVIEELMVNGEAEGCQYKGRKVKGILAYLACIFTGNSGVWSK